MTSETDTAESHLLYVWTPNGYRVEERSGPAPELLSHVELDQGGRYQVHKVGASPFPGDGRPCAFLIAAP